MSLFNIPEVFETSSSEYKDELMKFPTTPHEWRAIADMLKERWHFPHICGALDGEQTVAP